MGLVHQRLCREVLNRRNTLRTVRQRTADGPPEAVQNLTEAVPVGLQCKDSTADGPPGYRGRSARLSRTVREWTERRILTARLVISYKGISLVDHIHLGANEMFELDIYALVTCYKMIDWIKRLVIKFELVLNGYDHEMTFIMGYD